LLAELVPQPLLFCEFYTIFGMGFERVRRVMRCSADAAVMCAWKRAVRRAPFILSAENTPDGRTTRSRGV